jgi:hypothetical protein
MADLDDLAAVASQFLQSYSKVQDISALRDQLLQHEEDMENAPIYQRARISLISVTDAILTVEVPVSVALVKIAGAALGTALHEQLQTLAETAPQVNSLIQEQLQCLKNPSTSPAANSTATTATG